MRNRRPSPEHEQAVARRLALLAEEWDTAKAAGAKETEVRSRDPEGESENSDGPHGPVPPGGEWPWNPPTRVAGRLPGEESVPSVGAARPISPALLAEVVPEEIGPEEIGPEEILPEEILPVVATRGEPLLEEAVPGGEAPLVRAPGRHAARRGSQRLSTGVATALTARLGSPFAGVRARLNAAHLTWVAVFVACALGLTCWWLVAAKESAVLTPVSATLAGSEADSAPPSEKETEPDSAAKVTEVPDGAGSARPDGGEEVVVDVAGKVRRPGIVVLPVGARVVDAIKAAGGAKRGVDLTSLNLARLILDGEQILVGKVAATGVGAAPPAGAPSSSTGALVNLNSASQTELETLPGVGPVTAAAIVEWRTRHGGFTSVEDLLEVDGIGAVTLRRLAPLVSV